MGQENADRRREVGLLLDDLAYSHTDLENFHHRTMQYIEMILLNKHRYDLDDLVVSQLESIIEISDSFSK